MTTQRGRELTLEHYRQQVALRAQAVRDAHTLWSLWAPGSNPSWSAMVAIALTVVKARHAQSAALAARYFEAMATIETFRPDRAVAVPPLPDAMIERSLASTGLVGTYAAKSRGLSLPAAALVGLARFQGGLSRLALEGGRETIVRSVEASRRATGWQRVVGGNACEFCVGLADEPGAGDFQAHDNCACSGEPIFGGAA